MFDAARCVRACASGVGDIAAADFAIDRLLVCAAGTDASATCIDGWSHDAGTLVPSKDQKRARGLLGYYIDQVLRAPPAKRDRYCGA